MTRTIPFWRLDAFVLMICYLSSGILAGGILARAFGVPVHASRTGEASERQMVGELNIMPAFTWWGLLIPKHGRGILD